MVRRLTLALIALTAAVPAQAQAPRLGTVDFPTSGTPSAQAAFVRGVLYLHSFEYPSAAAAFREAQRLAPDFAMAYWGEAMTLNHPVWDEQDSVAARAILSRLGPTPAARQAKAPTAREQGYLHAVDLLYGNGGPKPLRDTLYSAAMDSLAAAYPADAEAQAFYALSLLGLSQGDRVVPTYMRAGAIALALMQQYPDHPGAVHYAIHSFDDPDHAILGLAAARAYSRIAPGAPHAQHMTTHIYLALGMWDDVVSQNVIAIGPDKAKWVPGHYTQWLQYGLLQLGRAAAADSLRLITLSNPGTPMGPSRASSALNMRAAQVVNAEQWREPSLYTPLGTANTAVGPEAADAFALGFAALQRGEPREAEAERARLSALQQRVASRPDYTLPGTVDALARELDAAIAFQAGHRDEALVLIAEANHIEDGLPVEFGPPTIVKPTWELRGEMLLGMERPREARDAFVRSLALQPNRLLSVRGLAAANAALAPTAKGSE